MKVMSSKYTVFYLQKCILECVENHKLLDIDFWYTNEELESVLLALFKQDKISLKEMSFLGIPSSIVDSIAILKWFSKKDFETILNMSDDYHKALVIIGRIYAEKTDRSGYPQSKHLISVSNGLDTEEEKTVGLLHDVVEDGYLTLTSLCRFKISPRIIRAVATLTRDKEIHPTYDSYIKNQILPSKSLIVLKTKLKDMKNNQSLERVKDLPTEERRKKALTKYKPYIPLVENRIEEVTLNRKKRFL